MDLNNKKAYPKLCIELLATLENNLPAHLTYHSLAHIIDVANVCDAYINYYKIDEGYAKLIRIAAIGHDLGYMTSPDQHEERSITMLSQVLPQILEPKEIKLVNGMIRATKVPQKPKTFYEEILADADLDYLGRSDYDQLSKLLFKEFLFFNVVKNQKEWLDVQIQFLANHKFHTPFAQRHRKPSKLEKLKKLKQERAAL
jgi:predicted metal-dependent HD superfamily phosphohydrolase